MFVKEGNHVKHRIMAALAAIVVAVGLTVAPAAPARAAYGGTCATNAICLYQGVGLWTQVAGDRWQSSFNNIINNGGCLNLGNAAWDNGTLVRDNSGSLMYVVGSGYSNYAIRVYDWVNCNFSGPSRNIGYAANNTTYTMDNLNNYLFSNNNPNGFPLYHRITSIGISDPLD